MNTFEQLSERRLGIKSKLKTLAFAKCTGSLTIKDLCETIAPELKTSTQTVYNYISGRVKDGYLADAIYTELRKIKKK